MYGQCRAALLLLAGTLVCAGGNALAAQWKTVRIAPDKTTYIDINGLLRSGDAVQAWELEKFASDQESRAWEGKYRAVKSLTGYDCQRRTTEPLLRVYLSAEGAELKRVQMQGLQFPSAVDPDSLQEKMLEQACARKDKREKKAADKPKPGLLPEAAAADMPKEASTAAKAAKDKVPGVAKAEEKARPDEKARVAEKLMPAKLALLSRTPEARPVEPPKAAATPMPAKPERSRVILRRERAKSVAHATGAVRKPATHEVHWAYAGEWGVDRWAAIRPEFAACAEGKQQSPIDIRDGARLELDPIEFSYAPGTLRVIDNGHTVQVNIDAGRYIVVLGKRYDLKQFHFHNPAEERIDGRTYDMVAHLVHKDGDGRIAVVAILFEAGADNAFIRKLWPYLPLEQGRETYLPEVRLELDKMLPESRTYYTYMGSLTTPPCTEGVLWIVMKNPVPVSGEQIAVFSRLYPMNARPIQEANGRFIKESM